MMKKSWDIEMTIVLTLGIILCFFVPATFAQGNITIGRLEIHPGISYTLESNDNIYVESTNEQDDIIHRIKPSITIGYTRDPGNYLTVGYSPDLVAYSEFDDNNYQSHNPFIDFGYKSPMGFYLKTSTYFTKTEDPFGAENQYGLGEKTERWNNRAKFVLGYEFNRYAVEVMYEHWVETYDLDKDKWQARKDNTFSTAIFFSLTPKTAIFGEYRWTGAEYFLQDDGASSGGTLRWSADTAQDYSLDNFFLGVRFRPGAKLSGDVKIGYGGKHFDNAFDITGSPYKDFQDWIAETMVSYQVTSRTLISLNLMRAPMGSPDGDAAAYLDTRISYSMMQQLANRLSFFISVDWNNNDYQNELPNRPEKKLDIYGVAVNLDYNINDWLKAGIGYRYSSKEVSNAVYNNLAYDNNIFSFMVLALF